MTRSFEPADRRRPTPTDQTLAEVLDQISAGAAALKPRMAELARRDRHDTADGYPSLTSSAVNVRGSGVPDPIGEAVVVRLDAARENRVIDPIRAAYRKAAHGVLQALVWLQEAESAVNSTKPPAPVAGTEGFCAVHGDFGFVVAARSPRGDRCRWCADFERSHGRRATRPEIQGHEDRVIERDRRVA